MAKRAYVGINTQMYTELGYIESSGTQWLDTQIIPTQDTKVEAKFLLTDNTQGEYSGAFGAQNDSSNTIGFSMSNRIGQMIGFKSNSSWMNYASTQK